MERNRWETAIRCLEIAVHPNTDDREIVAAVNGFRRTATGLSLRQLVHSSDCTAPAIAAADELRRLARENYALRQKIDDIEGRRTTLLKRLRDAEHRADAMSDELLAAARRADAAEQRLAEFRGAYSHISSELDNENFDLRRALQEARRNLAQPIHEPVAPFQAALKAALQGSSAASPGAPAAIVSPWTA
ncbi:MAG TPA: hypothetical protein VMI30_00675 [Stellaceae bacterium]|nr:hypothetical protein [Stellaceae bacterium]